MRHADEIVAALQRLFGAASCSLSVSGIQQWAQLSVLEANPTARLVVIAKLLLKHKGQDKEAWIGKRISEIAVDLEAFRVSLPAVVGSVEALKRLRLLDSVPGKQLVDVLKVRAMNEPQDLDDFETLANVVSVLPKSFSDDELEAIREAYAEFSEHYAGKCDLGNPNELREEANRIEEVGDLLQVDTAYAQDTLKESADEIEKAEWSGEDEYERDHGAGSDECSDAELDSMFGTLGS